MVAPAKGLLKAASVLLIFFGTITAAVLLIGLIAYAVNVSIFGELAGIIIVTIVLTFFISILELVLGIIGMKKLGDRTKGGYFVATGSILCALSLVSMVLSIAGGSFQVTSLGVQTGTMTIIGFILPILYIIGGAMDKRTIAPVSSKSRL